MFSKYILPLLAIAGLGFAVFTVTQGDQSPAPSPPIVGVPPSPYPSAVAGAGLIEANTENIAISPIIAGVVAKVYVRLGDQVKAGDPLFALDDRAVGADLAVRRATVPVAQAQIADAKYQFNVTEALAATQSTSTQDRESKRHALQKAEAQLTQAEAAVLAGEVELDRLVVRAPVAGQVLQLKIHAGEFAAPASPAPTQQPLLLLGNVTPLNVRVDVNEFDAGRVRTGAAATGYLRGAPTIRLPLTFVRFEPYVLPKKSLTGDTTERVDTRVLQVIFSFERSNLPIFVGQQMDVFIDAAESGGNPRPKMVTESRS